MRREPFVSRSGASSPLARMTLPGQAERSLPTWTWLAAAVFVLASLDRPSQLRLIFRGVPVDLGHAGLWLLCAWLLLARGRRERIGDGWHVLAAGAPWLAAMVLSGAVNLPAHQVLPYAVRAWTPCLALFVGWLAFGTPRRRWALEAAVVTGTILQAVVVVGQLLLTHERPTGTFFIATALGGYMALVLPLAVARSIVPSPGRTGWRALAAVAAIVLLLSLSRAPLFAALAGCAVTVVGMRNVPSRRRRRMAATALAAATLLLVLLVVGARVSSGGSAGDADSDWQRFDPRRGAAHLLDLRLPIYRLGWDIWRDHPWLGIGGASRYRRVAAVYATDMAGRYGYAADSYPEEAARRTYLHHVHQLYLQLAVEYGALGLLAWTVLLAWVFLRLGSRLSSEPEPGAAVGIGVLVAFLLHGMLDLMLPTLGIELGLLVGAGLGSAAGFSPSSRLPRPDR